MKKVYLIAAVAVALSVSASAQKSHKKDRLEGIELTTQQKASVDSLKKIYQEKNAAIKKDASLSAEDKKEKLKESRKEQTGKVNAILTKEQLDQIKKEAKKEKQDQ
jgi:hypothetical protein